MRVFAWIAVLFVSACAHQDLKAPHDEGRHGPVLNQWGSEEQWEEEWEREDRER